MTTETALDKRFLGFQEYIDQQARGFSSAGAPPYAHPVDQWILRSLDSLPVRTLLSKALDSIISLQLGQYLATGISIDEKSFPDLFAILSHCAPTLGIPIPHAVANDVGTLFNAFTAGTDDYSVIVIAPALYKHFSRDEASFVVGHECGHIAAKHMEYHTLAAVLIDSVAGYLGPLGRIISQTAGLPLRAWARRSEVTSDRAGLLCCGDIRVAERALLHLVTGLADVERVDVDDYLRKYRDVEALHGHSWQQVFSTHPVIPKRIQALRLFAESELYYSLSGKTPPPGVKLLDRDELDRRVNAIVKP